jgi:hypothetical protein
VVFSVIVRRELRDVLRFAILFYSSKLVKHLTGTLVCFFMVLAYLRGVGNAPNKSLGLLLK